MEAPKNGSKISYVDMANAPRVERVPSEVDYNEESSTLLKADRLPADGATR